MLVSGLLGCTADTVWVRTTCATISSCRRHRDQGSQAVRATTVFNRLLDLAGVWVMAVEFDNDDKVVFIDVRLRRRRLACPHCGWTTAARHNWQPRPSTWRALDFGVWRVLVRCRLRRLGQTRHDARRIIHVRKKWNSDAPAPLSAA